MSDWKTIVDGNPECLTHVWGYSGSASSPITTRICSICGAEEQQGPVSMAVTPEWLETLLMLGWKISGWQRALDGSGALVVAYTRPDGANGSQFDADNLQRFPVAVSEWLIEHVPMVPA